MKASTKSFIRILVIVAITLCFVLCLMSCSKEDEILVPTEKVKIFMSAPTSQKSGLKSATTVTERTEINEGDTVDVYNVKDINIVLVAENEDGFKKTGTWSIGVADNELSDKMIGGLYLLEQPGDVVEGSSIGIKLKMLGLYHANFLQKSGAEKRFFIRHLGMPGDIGDNWENRHAFRLEKNLFQWYGENSSESKLKKGYTLFLNYNEGEFGDETIGGANPSDEKNFHAFMFAQNHTYVFGPGANSGLEVKGKIFKVNKCKYSPGYISFSFLEEDIVSFNGIYEIDFYSGDYETWRFSFQAINRSNWTRGGMIVFKAF